MHKITLNKTSGDIQLTRQDNDIQLSSRNNTIKFSSTGIRGPQGADGDKHYNQSFINSSSVLVTHSLGKRPAISVEDSAGDVVEGDVKYVDSNSILVQFSSSFTGRIICN